MALFFCIVFLNLFFQKNFIATGGTPASLTFEKILKFFFSAKENSGIFFSMDLHSLKNRLIHQIIVKNRSVSGFSDVIDLVGFIVRLAGVFCDNRTIRFVKKGVRKTPLNCTVLFALKWVFWQNNDFDEEYCRVLAPFPLEPPGFFSG